MNILGVSCFDHDSAAALIQDGRLVAAAEEERFSRIRHDFGYPELAIQFCLQSAGITAKDVDHVVYYEKPFLKFERIVQSALQTFPRSYEVFRESMIAWLSDRLWIRNTLADRMDIDPKKVIAIDHHASHAASTFFASPFDEAAVLTVDGVGEWATTTFGTGKDTKLELHRELRFPHSLGLLSSAFTAYLGFEVDQGECEVMGMAAYGQPKYVDKVWKLIELGDDGSFRLKMDYFSYHHSARHTIHRKFIDLFGPARAPSMDFFTPGSGDRESFGPGRDHDGQQARQSQFYADVASSIQEVTEEVLLHMARALHRETGQTRLCMAGRVALNSVANTRILHETPFEELYVQPAAGDGGGAVGAALYCWHHLLGKPRGFVMDHACWGRSYTEGEAVDWFRSQGIAYEIASSEDAMIDQVVDSLRKGSVIGWHQGRFEWGPRALGCRSILADPTRAGMKDIIHRIKCREPYRPFAPSVLAEAAERYFELPNAAGHLPARFMLLVVPVRPEHRATLPAITHVDGSSRLQTVVKETNPLYHRLISRFGEATGVPVVLNTSYNRKGEPIVNTPRDAYHTFMKADMDLLAVGNVVVRKRD